MKKMLDMAIRQVIRCTKQNNPKPLKRRSKYSCAHRESGQVRAGSKCSLPNGPRRAQSKGNHPEYSATCGHTSVAGDMSVSRRAHGKTVNQGGTAEIILYEFTVLDRIVIFCQGLFLFLIQNARQNKRQKSVNQK